MAGHVLALTSESPESSPPRPAEAASRADVRVTHAIEDVLLGLLIVAVALDDRVPPRTASNIIELFLDAHREGRANDLIESARREAQRLPDWECKSCLESNPGTFEICWNCRLPQQPGTERLDAKSEVVLEIEAAVAMKCREAPPCRIEHEHPQN